jgi:hypothetical protein
MRTPLIATLTLLAAFAFADGQLASSYGKGRTTTSDGRLGSFDYEVAKRTAANGSSTLAGRFRFEQQPNVHGRYVLIEMSKLQTMGVGGAGNAVAEFGGKAVLVTIVDGRRVQFGGTVSVRVVDRHDPKTGKGDPDQFRVRFAGEKGLTFASEGLVVDGDLVVSQQTTR